MSDRRKICLYRQYDLLWWAVSFWSCSSWSRFSRNWNRPKFDLRLLIKSTVNETISTKFEIFSFICLPDRLFLWETTFNIVISKQSECQCLGVRIRLSWSLFNIKSRTLPFVRTLVFETYGDVCQSEYFPHRSAVRIETKRLCKLLRSRLSKRCQR